eukprot:snap_masked-scaffold_1-processed-gene-14.23-mRNA-1 protein AED:1.00 eAED:1.00 QI:0/0/0/0/1/1/2/0/141
MKLDDIPTENITNAKRMRKMVLGLLQVTEQCYPRRNFAEIRESEDFPAWINAYEKEKKTLETVGSFEVVNRPNTEEVIILILELFNTKDIYRNHLAKVRIVAKGDYSKLIIPDTAVAYSPALSVILTCFPPRSSPEDGNKK